MNTTIEEDLSGYRYGGVVPMATSSNDFEEVDAVPPAQVHPIGIGTAA